MAALEGLEDLVMEILLSKLGPKSVAVLACVSARLRAAAADDALWRGFCCRDLDLSAPLDPGGDRCPSFKVAYQMWRESFAMYPWQLVRRAKKCWSNIKGWTAANFPEAGETLQKGASEAEVEEVEKKLGVKLPLPARVLYRFCNGQDTMSNDVFENERLFPLGIIGGYCFYDHHINVHLLPLSEVLEETREYRNQLGFSIRSKYIVVAVSYFVEKLFFLNCANGQLYVGTRNLSTDGEMLPCVPRALISSLRGSDGDTLQDAMLLWLEEHNRSLQSGLFQLRELDKKKMICLFPETPPSCNVATTNGLKIRTSAVLVPELCDLNDEQKYWFAYSIRISLSPEGCTLDGVRYDSCQLDSRHWIIRSNDNVVSNVRGEGVIGKFPLLVPDMEEFVYESCTSLPASPGSMEGSFTFVPGRLTDPKGREFRVEVPRVSFKLPSYIF
uniref:F-box protein SKIP16 n=1 Tax=Anthurium amnicola TaxID=1678845 RepID=A0A1D1YR28_9ARAE